MAAEASTFVFADIAGFNALTEAHGDEAALELIGTFCSIVDARLPDIGGQHVARPRVEDDRRRRPPAGRGAALDLAHEVQLEQILDAFS